MRATARNSSPCAGEPQLKCKPLSALRAKGCVSSVDLALAAAMASHVKFDMGVPIRDRVAVLSPVLNMMIEEHEAALVKGDGAVRALAGGHAFRLREDKWLDPW